MIGILQAQLIALFLFSTLIAQRLRRNEKTMSALDDKIAILEADVASVKADHDALAAKVADEAAQIAALQAELAAAHAAGEPITAEQLAKLDEVHAGLQTAIAPAPRVEPPAAA